MSTVGQVINCRAAIAWEPNKPLIVEDIQVSPPRAHEVRIKMLATGVCHSDANAMAGHDINAVLPSVLGHEGAGIVESVGEGVTKFKRGDHVVPLFIPCCNECSGCKSNKTNLCFKIRLTQNKGLMPDGTTRFTCRGQQIFHFTGTSTFSEYTVVAEVSLCKIDVRAPLDKVCLLGCCIPTGYGAALNTAKVEPGSICAVWGLGAVGLATVMGCRKAGAAKVYGIDINPAKFELGKQFGLTDFINPKDIDEKVPIQAYLTQLTGGGFDYAFECIGNVNTMRTAFESTKAGWGTCVVIGLVPVGHEISTSPLNFVVGRTLKGCAYGGCKGPIDIPQFVEDYLSKKLMIDEFITHTMKLDAINEAFDLMLSGKSIRTVIKYENL